MASRVGTRTLGLIVALAVPALAIGIALQLLFQPLAIAQPQSAPATDRPFTIALIQPSNEVPPPDGELTAVLKAEVAKAKQAHRKPYAYFYADWCGPCKALRKSLDDNDPLMVDAFRGTYIVQLNADTWGKRPDAQPFDIKAIPVLFELDNDGRPTGRKIDGSAWGDDIPRNMAPPLKAFFRNSAKKPPKGDR
jgi:thiol-disulfide isomerase/thioredoxin